MSYVVRRGRKRSAVLPPGPKERAARQKWRETWLVKNPEFADIASKLGDQLDKGEISEADYWWLLGEDQPND